MTEHYKIWIDQCEAAEGIEDDCGTQKALEYLVGEKFLNFLEAKNSHYKSPFPRFIKYPEGRQVTVNLPFDILPV